MSIYEDTAVPRTAWRPWSRDYAGFGVTPFEERRRLRPRPPAKRASSRRVADRPTHFLVIDGAAFGDGIRMLVSERKVPYRVGLRLVNWLRGRGHMAFLY